jgi:hypothetical protein
MFNTVAKARLSFNKKLKMYKLICAFNVTQRNAATGALMFPVQKKCDFVSGDFAYEDLQKELALAQKALRTNNIVFAK